MTDLPPKTHNQSPFELSKTAIEELYDEAKLWLDGEKVTTQDQADALNTLETRIRKAAKEAEENRKSEAKPFDDGKKEVQERYKPILNKSDEAINAVKAALKPYLLELARIQDEKAKAARKEAQRLQEEAMNAMRERDAANLQSREEAEKIAEAARKAEDAARKAEGEKAHAKGEGRATGLRTVWKAVLSDEREAAAWVWNERREELMAFVQEQADKAVRSGARTIRGFNVISEKVL